MGKSTQTIDEPKYKMDIGFSVFNCHLNNAKNRAIKDVKDKFGEELFKSKLKHHLRNGIMAIFNEKPNEVTQYFADKVTEYVNEDRIDEPQTWDTE